MEILGSVFSYRQEATLIVRRYLVGIPARQVAGLDACGLADKLINADFGMTPVERILSDGRYVLGTVRQHEDMTGDRLPSDVSIERLDYISRWTALCEEAEMAIWHASREVS